MGNTTSDQITYALPVPNTETKDCTQIYRCASHPDELVEAHLPNLRNCWDLFCHGAKHEGGNRPCFGRRNIGADGKLSDEFVFMTYNEAKQEALYIGSGLQNLGCVEPKEFVDEKYPGARKLKMFGLFSRNTLEWLICEQAANAYGLGMVPLYDTLGQQALEFIFQATGMTTVVVSAACLPSLLVVAEKSSLKKIVLMDEPDGELVRRAKSAGLEVISWRMLRSSGLSHTRSPTPPPPEAVSTLCFTSGTTGNPKGVILTHANIVACVGGTFAGPIANGGLDIDENDIHISYLPLAHVFERLVVNVVLTLGGSVAAYSGDTMKLLEDIKLLNPTVFVSVPRLFNRINDKVLGGLKERSTVSQYLFNNGMNNKLDTLRNSASTNNAFWDTLVFNKTRQLMGTRMRFMICGGAPIDAVVQERMKVFFCCPVMEGFGMTETFGPAFLSAANDPLSGHVGGVFPCVEFKLKSVLDMDYDVKEMPRGELLLRGPSITKGYFLNPKETQAAIDEDGWLHTGDIVALLPNGAVKIVDRRKNIFKLAQGEYVAPEKVESVYVQAPLVAQVFAFGYSTKTMLIGIVVPDEGEAKHWAKEQGLPEGIEFAELCKNKEFKKAVMEEMNDVASSGGLKGFEKIKAIHLSAEGFTVENGMLTPTFKIKRHDAKIFYEREIEAMYASLGQ